MTPYKSPNAPLAFSFRRAAKRARVEAIARLIGVPEGNRTPDPRFRKPVLYPAELPGPLLSAAACGPKRRAISSPGAALAMTAPGEAAKTLASPRRRSASSMKTASAHPVIWSSAPAAALALRLRALSRRARFGGVRRRGGKARVAEVVERRSFASTTVGFSASAASISPIRRAAIRTRRRRRARSSSAAVGREVDLVLFAAAPDRWGR